MPKKEHIGNRGTLQPPASIHFVHYEAEVKGHGKISREVTLAQVLEGADDGQEQEESLFLCGSGGLDVVSDSDGLWTRIHLHSLIGTTHWFNGITPDFYDSHLAVIAVRTAHPHNAVYPKATIPEVVSDLLDEIRAGWCVDNSQIYATGLPSAAASSTPSPAPPVGRNFAAFATGSGSFLLHRLRRRLGQLTSQPCTPARCPLPVLKIHGGSDTDVPYAGGEGRCLPFLIAAHNGCTAANTTETPFDGDVHHSSWACAEGESVLPHWKVDDMRELLTSSLVSCFVFCLHPTLISHHSTLLLPLLTDLLPLLFPCVSLRPTLPALPIFLRILVPKLLACTGLHFITAFPLFFHRLVFLSSPRLLSPPPISLTRSLFSYSTHPFANATAGPPPRSTPPRTTQSRDPRPSTRARL
ncbi:hypothetical protein B0H14DRAFT_3707244 [Mycena olivaceomarginata]|nr:hypothetical protein B0H14DRAFT_3707244 [Mycena olivaceomarginata]